ncbi:MAG TPA: cAMP-binding protein, partial [Spirochaetia bacterium]|nr:cAMP-binding protein [Spirochaetia bacterium]
MSEQAKLGLIKYKKGTYILIEGDEGKEIFYIVKEGSIQIDRSVEKIVQAKGEILQPGDFFGVISAMSRHPSTETAFTLTDTVLITVGSEQFGYLIKQSTPLAMKIIRYFSKKLRFFDSLLTQLSSKKKEEDSDFSQIYEIADYYFNSGNVPLSLYAYHKYLELVPEGELKVKANEMLQRYGRFKEQAFNPPANIGGFNRKYKKDTFIFCEHEEGKDLFIIQQGKVKITKLLGGREVLLAVLKAGDIFGEMSILENQPRSASAIAFDGDVNLLAVNQQNFSNMVVEQPQLATRLITLLS